MQNFNILKDLIQGLSKDFQVLLSTLFVIKHFKRLIRPPETVVPGKPYVLLLLFFFQREISAKFWHMFRSMFNL